MATTADGLVLLLAVLVLAVDGNSLGLNVPICDTDDPKIWKPKNAGGKYMYWCAAPKHTDDFSVRAGDGDKAQVYSTQA